VSAQVHRCPVTGALEASGIRLSSVLGLHCVPLGPCFSSLPSGMTVIPHGGATVGSDIMVTSFLSGGFYHPERGGQSGGEPR
jgi:hypothetical protein